MKWKGPVAKLTEVLVRRRQRKIHPAVGLPKDAPAYLEAEDGSFVRVLREEEYLPFAETGAKPRAWTLVLFALAALFFALYALTATLNPDQELFSPLGIVATVSVFLFLLSSLLALIPPYLQSLSILDRGLYSRLPEFLR